MRAFAIVCRLGHAPELIYFHNETVKIASLGLQISIIASGMNQGRENHMFW